MLGSFIISSANPPKHNGGVSSDFSTKTVFFFYYWRPIHTKPNPGLDLQIYIQNLDFSLLD